MAGEEPPRAYLRVRQDDGRVEDGPGHALGAGWGGERALVPVEVQEVFWQHGLDVQRSELCRLTSKRNRGSVNSSR